jgi:hypothetical protein
MVFRIQWDVSDSTGPASMGQVESKFNSNKYYKVVVQLSNNIPSIQHSSCPCKRCVGG